MEGLAGKVFACAVVIAATAAGTIRLANHPRTNATSAVTVTALANARVLVVVASGPFLPSLSLLGS